MAVKNPNSLGVIVVPGPAGQSIPGPPGAPSTVPGPPGRDGINGADGRDGVGITPIGSFTTFADLPNSANRGDTYLAYADDTASPSRFSIGDGLVWTGAGNDLGPGGNYHNVGPVRGPPGATTIDGLSDATSVGKALIKSTTRFVSDADVTASVTDIYIGFTSLTAQRTVTLPDVDAYPLGVQLFIADETGQCSASLPIVIAVGAGTGDSIAGQQAEQLTNAYQGLGLRRGATNVWIIAR